jgi:hypothetical protein
MPLASGDGRILRARTWPVPASLRVTSGTSRGFEEVTLKERDDASVSASVTVRNTSGTGSSSFTVILFGEERVGGVFSSAGRRVATSSRSKLRSLELVPLW